MTDPSHLTGAVHLWPTPSATDHKGAGQSGSLRDRLDYAAERGATKSKIYPTPKGSPSGPDYARMNRSGSGGDDLVTAVAREEHGQLNPEWVEWLMGFPLGWTDLEDSETQ